MDEEINQSVMVWTKLWINILNSNLRKTADLISDNSAMRYCTGKRTSKVLHL